MNDPTDNAVQYNRDEEPIVIHKPTTDRLLELDNPGDAMALYHFYYYTAKYRHSDYVWANNNYVAKGLKWSDNRLAKAKRDLLQLELIEQPKRQWSPITKKLDKPLIKINFILWDRKRVKSYTPQILHPKEPTVVGKGVANIRGTNNEVKRDSIISKERVPLNPQIKHFVKKFYDIQKEQFPHMIKNVASSQIEQSCAAVEKLVRIDKFELPQIFKAVLWAIENDFWAKNLLSLTGLRNKSKNGSTKFQNILAQMEPSSTQSTQNKNYNSSPPKQLQTLSCPEAIELHKIVVNFLGQKTADIETTKIEESIQRMKSYHAALTTKGKALGEHYASKMLFTLLYWNAFFKRWIKFLQDKQSEGFKIRSVYDLQIGQTRWREFIQDCGRYIDCDMETGRSTL